MVFSPSERQKQKLVPNRSEMLDSFSMLGWFYCVVSVSVDWQPTAAAGNTQWVQLREATHLRFSPAVNSLHGCLCALLTCCLSELLKPDGLSSSPVMNCGSATLARLWLKWRKGIEVQKSTFYATYKDDELKGADVSSNLTT